MNAHMPAHIHWSTACFTDAAVAAPADLYGLGQHMQQCSLARGRTLYLRGGLDALHRNLSARFVTSLSLLLVLVVGTTVLLW